MPKRTVASVFGEETSDKLARLAMDMLIEPPANQSKYAMDARIPWSMIREGRQIMEEGGIKWRELKKTITSQRYQRRQDASTTDSN